MADLRTRLIHAAGAAPAFEMVSIRARTHRLRRHRSITALLVSTLVCSILATAAVRAVDDRTERTAVVAGPATQAAPSTQNTSGQAMSGPFISQPCDESPAPGPADPELSAVAESTRRVAMEATPDYYAGIVINTRERVVDVFLKRGANPGATDSVLAASHDLGRINWVDRSQKELDSVRAHVMADLSWFSSIRLEPVRWSQDVQLNVVEVGVRSFTADQRLLVERRYGPVVKLCGPEAPLSSGR